MTSILGMRSQTKIDNGDHLANIYVWLTDRSYRQFEIVFWQGDYIAVCQQRQDEYVFFDHFPSYGELLAMTDEWLTEGMLS